jgi:hypothetical protein
MLLELNGVHVSCTVIQFVLNLRREQKYMYLEDRCLGTLVRGYGNLDCS